MNVMEAMDEMYAMDALTLVDKRAPVLQVPCKCLRLPFKGAEFGTCRQAAYFDPGFATFQTTMKQRGLKALAFLVELFGTPEEERTWKELQA